MSSCIAYFQRLLACFLLLWAGSAHALFSMPSGPDPAVLEPAKTSNMAACNASASYGPGCTFKVLKLSDGPTRCNNGGDGYCLEVWTKLPNVPWNQVLIPALAACPANSIPAGGSNCACAAGFVENNTPDGERCISPDQQKCQQNQISWNLLGVNRDVQVAGNQRDGEFCMPLPDMTPGKGCVMKFEWETSFDKGPDAGGWVSEGKGATPDSAEVCSTGEGDDMEKDTCKNGDKGTVNGVEVCVPRDPNKPTETKDGTKTTKTDPDGTKTETETKKETKCDGDKCTTTTTTTTTVTAPDGTKTTTTDTEEKEQGKGGFCEENPKSKVCGDGQESNFSGSCDRGFTCEGDAIQCAMAKEQHAMNCKLLDTKNPDSFFKAAADGTDDKGADKLRENAEQVNVSSLDSSGLGFSRGCPADPSFEVAGKSFSIPFSKVCGPLSVLAHAAVALTLLGSLLWVVGTGIKA